jgi:hypothetical protein
MHSVVRKFASLNFGRSEFPGVSLPATIMWSASQMFRHRAGWIAPASRKSPPFG